MDGEQLLTAETDDEFAERISLVLNDHRLSGAARGGARAWAERNLTWEATLDRFDDPYARLLGGA